MKIREKFFLEDFSCRETELKDLQIQNVFRWQKSTKTMIMLFFFTLGVGTQYSFVLFFISYVYLMKAVWHLKERRERGREKDGRREEVGMGMERTKKEDETRQTTLCLRPKNQPGEQRQHARGGAGEGASGTQGTREAHLL